MKLLLHICCAPCSIFPLDQLTGQGHAVMGYFYGNNIHPFTEYQRRRQTLESYAESIGLRVIYQQDYDLENFLRDMVFRESQRCRICYHARLRATALVARRGKFEAFSTTLLYSRFQKHDSIAEVGHAVGRDVGVPFLYVDFRPGWKAGIEASRRLGLYRQAYCGCIYSEKERFYAPAATAKDDGPCSAT